MWSTAKVIPSPSSRSVTFSRLPSRLPAFYTFYWQLRDNSPQAISGAEKCGNGAFSLANKTRPSKASTRIHRRARTGVRRFMFVCFPRENGDWTKESATCIPAHRRKTNWYSGTPGRLLLRGSLDWEVATDLRAFAVSTLDSARGSVGTLVPRHGSAPYSPSFAARHRGFVLGCLSPGGHPTSPRQRLKGAYRQCDLRRPPDSSLARAHPMHRVVPRE